MPRESDLCLFWCSVCVWMCTQLLLLRRWWPDCGNGCLSILHMSLVRAAVIDSPLHTQFSPERKKWSQQPNWVPGRGWPSHSTMRTNFINTSRCFQTQASLAHASAGFSGVPHLTFFGSQALIPSSVYRDLHQILELTADRSLGWWESVPSVWGAKNQIQVKLEND